MERAAEKQNGKYFERVEVLSQESLTGEIMSMWIRSERIARAALPGQFLSLYCRDSSRLLPRPISICETDAAAGSVRMVYRIAGSGTREFAQLKAGDTLEVLGPLGNGFPVPDAQEGKEKTFLLIGGGIGVPPMVELAKRMPGRVLAAVGYRDRLFLTGELSAHGTLYPATEDGSVGTKGNVMDCIRENNLTADVVYACGPKPMLRAVKAFAGEKNIPCWISMEERMACGIGACLACVCRTRDTDAHSLVNNTRICAEGPVFEASRIEL